MKAAWCVIAMCGCTTIDDGFGLRIEARDASVVVFQDGDGAWQRLATTPDGVALVQVHAGSYGVGALCRDTTFSPTATFQFDTQAGTVFLPCATSIPVTPLHVRGTTEPFAAVWIDQRSYAAGASGAFDVQLYQPGLHDLFAVMPGMPPRIVAHRALAVMGDVRVDLPATDAITMLGLTPAITGGDPATRTVTADLTTPTDYVAFGGGPATIYVPPPAFLLPTDRVAIAASDDHCSRQVPLDAASAPIEIPAPLTYAFDRSHVEWTADPNVPWAWSSVDVQGSSSYHAWASASWREAMGTDSIPIVELRSLPGWTSDLAQLAPDQAATIAFSISRGEFDGDGTFCNAWEQVARW